MARDQLAEMRRARAAQDSAWFKEVSRIQDELRDFDQHVARIADLHSQALRGTEETTDPAATGGQNGVSLDEVVAGARGLTQSIKNAILELEKQPTPPGNQTKLLIENFVEALQRYHQVEQDYKERYKQRTERQFKIVKPDATPEEIRAVVENEGNGQVLQQALMNANLSGQSTMVYRSFRERHEENQKIERTLAEVAQIFNDMGRLVNQQEETINEIQASAQEVGDDGLQLTEVNIWVDRLSRRRRRFCLGICATIIVVLALAFGLGFGLHRKG